MLVSPHVAFFCQNKVNVALTSDQPSRECGRAKCVPYNPRPTTVRALAPLPNP